MPPARGDGGPAPSRRRRHGGDSRPMRRGARRSRPSVSRSSTGSPRREATKSGTDLAGGQAALFDQLQAQAVAKGVTLPGAQTQPAAPTTPVTSPRHADFVCGQQLKAAEAAAQIRDRKPVLSDADKAADAADQQLIDRYKASHGIPRTTGIDIARLPDDPPQAVRDTSPDPVPHPDTHVLPSHPHVDPGIPGSRVGALPAPVPGGAAVPFFAAIGAEHGISGNYLARTKQIESGSGSGVGAVSSSGATGPFQFTRDTARRMGLVDPNDLRESADAAARLAAQNKVALTRTLGRAPDDADLYLAHQQGSGGAVQAPRQPERPRRRSRGRLGHPLERRRPERSGLCLHDAVAQQVQRHQDHVAPVLRDRLRLWAAVLWRSTRAGRHAAAAVRIAAARSGARPCHSHAVADAAGTRRAADRVGPTRRSDGRPSPSRRFARGSGDAASAAAGRLQR